MTSNKENFEKYLLIHKALNRTTNKDLRISVLGKNSFHQPIFKKLK